MHTHTHTHVNMYEQDTHTHTHTCTLMHAYKNTHKTSSSEQYTQNMGQTEKPRCSPCWLCHQAAPNTIHALHHLYSWYTVRSLAIAGSCFADRKLSLEHTSYVCARYGHVNHPAARKELANLVIYYSQPSQCFTSLLSLFPGNQVAE